MVSNPNQSEEKFSEAYLGWDIERLYADLANSLKKTLSPNAKTYLRGVLCGYSPKEIADQLGLRAKDRSIQVRQILTTEVYQAVKNQLDIKTIKYNEISKLLEKKYKKTVKQSEASNYSDILNQLRDRCIELFNQEKLLTTNSLIAQQGMTFQIDDLFVPLGLVERQRPSKRQDIESAELGSRLYQPTENGKNTFDNQQQFFDQVIRDCNTPNSKGKRIVIIGEAGSGKTTLLQKIGGQLLPNSIPIWISLKRKGNQPLHQYLIQDWLRNAAEVLDNVPEEWKTALEELLKSNQVFLLLDGVDEMTTTSPLQAIGEQINQCKIFDSAGVILTCRSNLWEDYALPGFDAYQNLYFDYPNQVEQFIEQFFQKSTDDRDLGETLKTELSLENKSRIRDLVKNPLRLFLLCYAWMLGEGQLPNTQAELYKLFVETFYKVYQLKGSNFQIPVPKQKELEKGLGELSKAALDHKKFLLPESFIEQYLGHPDDENSLFYLAKKLNLLNCVGKCAENSFEDAYAFLHSTFQEYFAALVIDDWRKEFLNHVPHDPKLGIYRIFQPQWKQVILFWLGRDDVAKEAFIQKLVNFNDGCGEWSYENVDRGFYEYRAYFLAAAGINEFKQCSLSDKIVEQIVKWGFGYFNIEKQEWQTFLDPIQEGARTVLPETIRKNAIANLIKVLETTEDKYTRSSVANTLEKIAVGNELVIRELIRVLETTEDENTRSSVANTLGKIAVGNELAIQVLSRVLETTEDENTRSSVANTLGKIAVGNELAIQVLSRVLETTEDTYIRSRIAESLGEIAVGNELAIWALRRILETTEDKYTRRNIAYSLGKIDPGNELAIQALIQILETTENKYTRMMLFCLTISIEPLNRCPSSFGVSLSSLRIEFLNPRKFGIVR